MADEDAGRVLAREGVAREGVARGAGSRPPVRWSPALGRRICARLARGELIYALAREPGMPTPEAVAQWARQKPAFAAALTAARAAGGRPMGSRGGVSGYCPEQGEVVFQRLCEGESLTAIGRDPTMPCLSTLFRWRRAHPDFEELVQMGKAVQAERFCDLGWEMAREATPETAYLTNVRLGQLRWMAGVMAPRVFRLKPLEAEKPRETLDVVIRRFEAEVDPATGEMRTVAYRPNPVTGAVERED